MRFGGTYSKFSISTDHGNLDWQLWSIRLNYIYNSQISASSYLQYNSSTGSAVLNLRFHWILRNDSDLFIVFNERRINEDDVWTLSGRDSAVKVNYRIFF